MLIEIKNRFLNSVLFAHEADGNTVRLALQEAAKTRADLAGADLANADLANANLAGAMLENGEVLIGQRPVLQIGPIGGESRVFVAYLTDQGLRLCTGCFFGTREDFEGALSETHGGGHHAEEYRAALAFIDCHARLWGAP